MSSTLPFDTHRLRALADEIIVNARELSAAGLTPATSSNFSCRLDERHAAITVSGRDKGRLREADIMVVDMEGRAVGSEYRPSAETLLHTLMYRRFAELGAVLHTHSVTQTVASRLFADAGHVRFQDYEILKAFYGIESHAIVIDLPILPNTQDISALAAQVDALLDEQCMWGYLIAGHGLYAWGRDIAEARRHIEAFEFLLACELEMRRFK
ncbi:MAG: methylthioribulose 1-phosphate dehydratase [Gammaproteobacteria bacterium]